MPLDLVKFGMRALITRYNARHGGLAAPALGEDGEPLARTQSRAASVHASLYSNRTNFLVSF